MANEIETEIKLTKSAKSVKRVRFSDEIKLVDFHESDDSGSFSLDNENTTASVSSIEKPNDEVKEDSPGNNPANESNESIVTLGPDGNNNNELLAYPRNVTITYPLSPVRTETNESVSCDPPECSSKEKTDHENDISLESPELMDLINETKSMTISPTNIAKLIPDPSSEFKGCCLPPCGANAEKSECQASIREIKRKSGIPSSSRKRSLEGVLVEKQTSKLNTCLRKSNPEYGSADKLKSAVFNAWTEVKSESSVVIQALPSVSNVKKINEASGQSTSNRAYEMWKKSKLKPKKSSLKITEQPHTAPHKSKSKQDLEESKMAFKAWKKKKDELLKHQLTEKYRKEEKAKSASLSTERSKKTDAESAYSAWNAHKSVALKLEKKKRRWFLEREKEKLHVKMKKNDEAEKVYHDWLRNKVYSESSSTDQIFEDKPPWTPPGKGGNLM